MSESIKRRSWMQGMLASCVGMLFTREKEYDYPLEKQIMSDVTRTDTMAPIMGQEYVSVEWEQYPIYASRGYCGDGAVHPDALKMLENYYD